MTEVLLWAIAVESCGERPSAEFRNHARPMLADSTSEKGSLSVRASTAECEKVSASVKSSPFASPLPLAATAESETAPGDSQRVPHIFSNAHERGASRIQSIRADH